MAISPGGTVALRVVSLTYCVSNSVPDHLTLAPAMRELIFTVIVKAGPPASTAAGVAPVIVGPEDWAYVTAVRHRRAGRNRINFHCNRTAERTGSQGCAPAPCAPNVCGAGQPSTPRREPA